MWVGEYDRRMSQYFTFRSDYDFFFFAGLLEFIFDSNVLKITVDFMGRYFLY